MEKVAAEDTGIFRIKAEDQSHAENVEPAKCCVGWGIVLLEQGIVDLADKLLDYVLECDYSHRAAVLVGNYCEMHL